MASQGWQEFERLIAQLHREVAPSAEVRHNRRVQGWSGRRRQLDVTISQRVGPYSAFIVIECKKYRRPVSIEKVEAFASKLEDVAASHGVMISHKSFDAGARAVAKRKSITLLTYQEARPSKNGPKGPIFLPRMWASSPQVPMPTSVAIRFCGAWPSELRYPGQPDSSASNARGAGP
jgi:hypothetical protein